MRSIFWVLFFFLNVTIAWAAIPSKPLYESGYVAGGEAYSGVTLRTMKKIELSDSQVERFALEFGDRQGKPLVGKPGYFHVELKNKPKPVLIINVAKVVGTQIDKKNLEKTIRNSKFLTHPDIYQNADDGSQSYVFDLKSKPEVRVYQVSSKKGSSQMVIDVSARIKKK